MPFAAALSTAAAAEQALDEVCTQSRSALSGTPDLAVAFFSTHHAEAADRLAGVIAERLAPRCLLGCVAEAVIGNGKEIEDGPALSLWLGRWAGGVALEPFHAVLERTSEGPSLLGLPDGLVGADAADAAVLLLGDPYTFPADLFLQQMNENNAGLPVLGGLASGTHGPGQCRLLFDGGAWPDGAVGVLMRGGLGLRSIVSQGCRPIGRHMVVTRAEDNIILELSGRPPLQQLQELWQSLSPEEQNLFQNAACTSAASSTNTAATSSAATSWCATCWAWTAPAAPWRSRSACASARRCSFTSATPRRRMKTYTLCFRWI